MRNTIAKIAKELNAIDVIWAIGGSVMLSYYGLVENPNDIDIMVDENHIEKVDKAMRNIGIKGAWEKDAIYESRAFYEFIIDGFDVDIIAGFKIRTHSGLYQYEFDAQSITEEMKIEGEKIPICSLEEWYILYQMMPNRGVKVNLIENHLKAKGIKHPFLLERALRGNVNEQTRERSNALLNDHHAQINTKGAHEMEQRIETVSEKKMVGKKMTMTLSNNKTGELWKSFMQRRKEIQNTLAEELYSMQIHDPSFNFQEFDPHIPFEKWAATEVSNFEEIPPEMESIVVPPGLYAVFIHKGPASTAPKTFMYIFGDWLPHSEYEIDDRPHFEILGEKYKNEDPSSEEEVWIPIKPRKLVKESH